MSNWEPTYGGDFTPCISGDGTLYYHGNPPTIMFSNMFMDYKPYVSVGVLLQTVSTKMTDITFGYPKLTLRHGVPIPNLVFFLLVCAALVISNSFAAWMTPKFRQNLGRNKVWGGWFATAQWPWMCFFEVMFLIGQSL